MNRFDLVVAGGGLIGASIAFELASAGLQVGIYDAREPGREASWASAGMISPAPENQSMISFMPLSRASVALYPAFIRTIEELTGRDVGYRTKGTLEVILSGDAQEELSTVITLNHGLGLRAEAVSAERAREMEPGLTEDVEAAIFRPDEASLDNRAFTDAVLEAARRKGVQIFAGNGAKAIWREGGRCRGLLLEQGKVETRWTVIAAGCFSARIEGVGLYAPVFPAKGQMVMLRCEEASLEHTLWAENGYLVPRNDGRIVAGSTLEHTGFDHDVTIAGVRKILNAAVEVVPALEKARIEETWAGLRPDSPDHLPILGPTDVDGLLVATGHFRSGILLTPITAKLIREWITSQEVSLDWERLSPMRFLEARQSQGRGA
jgi:glycine oxidase